MYIHTTKQGVVIFPIRMSQYKSELIILPKEMVILPKKKTNIYKKPGLLPTSPHLLAEITLLQNSSVDNDDFYFEVHGTAVSLTRVPCTLSSHGVIWTVIWSGVTKDVVMVTSNNWMAEHVPMYLH